MTRILTPSLVFFFSRSLSLSLSLSLFSRLAVFLIPTRHFNRYIFTRMSLKKKKHSKNLSYRYPCLQKKHLRHTFQHDLERASLVPLLFFLLLYPESWS